MPSPWQGPGTGRWGRACTGTARVQTHELRRQPLARRKATENDVLLLRQHRTNLYYGKTKLKTEKQAINLEAGVASQFVVHSGRS